MNEPELFNFRDHWDDILPIIENNPLLETILKKHMGILHEIILEEFRDVPIQVLDDKGKKMINWKFGDSLFYLSDFNYIMSKSEPLPKTIEWYQCVGGYHYIAPFCAALGQILFTDLEWKVRTNDRYSVAIGSNYSTGEIERVFDILHFENAVVQQILDYSDYEINGDQYYDKWILSNKSKCYFSWFNPPE